MNRRILGFQRRVWCPKCTPESSSSCRVTSATCFFLPFGCSIHVVHRKRRPYETTGTSHQLHHSGGAEQSYTVGELAPRVGVVVHLLQSRLRDVGVDLGRRQALVTEQLLDDTKVGATLEEMRGVRVAKGVGMDVTPRHAVVEDSANIARSEAVAAPVVEEGQRRRVVAHDLLTRVVDPEVHG